MTQTRKRSVQKAGIEPGSAVFKVDALPTWPMKRAGGEGGGGKGVGGEGGCLSQGGRVLTLLSSMKQFQLCFLALSNADLVCQ